MGSPSFVARGSSNGNRPKSYAVLRRRPASERSGSCRIGEAMRLLTLGPFVLTFAFALVPVRAGDAAADLKAASEELHWTEEAEPVKIAGPVYFVGTQGLAVWLITTSKGHILIDTGMPGSGPMIEASIRKLGFKPEDVKLLVVTHAHVDHVGALAYLKKATGAKVVAIDREANLLRTGGLADFQYRR